ncbi:hypothetical protein J7E78_24140 [Paenibacillus polymyxa]|nr:hypothetical protein [Paenibacillus polymyxa]MBT2286618.1 hypothetical protein [Paenibacillus polymyxa]
MKWWDAVDLISSSGYYPIGDWEAQLDRIEQRLLPMANPFSSRKQVVPAAMGSARGSNDWGQEGEVSAEEQQRFYGAMFGHVSQREWVRGFGLWDWSAHLHDEKDALTDDGYGVYGKPAEQVICRFYESVAVEV